VDWWTRAHLTFVLTSLPILTGVAFMDRHVYRPQARIALAGLLLPVMGPALTLTGKPFLFYPELMPFLLAAGFLIAGWGLLRSRQSGVIPAAQQWLFEELSDAAIVLDARHHAIDLNPAAQQILGLAAADILGRPFDQICSDWPGLVNLIREGKESRQEITLRGEAVPHYLEVSITNLGNERGHPTGRLLVLRNVTEQKQAAEMLRDRGHRLEQAVEVLEAVTKGTEVMVAAVDLDFRYTFFNEAYQEGIQRLTGKDIGIGSNLIDTFADMREQQAVSVSQWSRTLHGENAKYRMEFGEPGGDRRVYSVRHTPLWDAQGNVAGAGEVAFDVTGQVQAEEALSREREWLQVTLNSIGDGMIAADIGGRTTFLNPVAAALTGWRQEEALGQPARIVFQIVDQRTGQPAEDIIGRVLGEGRAVTVGDDTSLVARDGRHIPIEASAAPILDATGNVAGVALVVHDVAEKRRALEALRESEERFHTIYDTAPVSIWQEDWTAVIEAIDGLRAQGVTDFPAYFRAHPGFVADMLQAVRIVDVNQWTVDTFGAGHKEDMLVSLGAVFATPETLPGFVAELTALAAGQQVFCTEMAVNTVRGDTRQILLSMSFPQSGSGSGKVLVSVIDITERQQAEQALRESEKRLERAQEIAHLGSWEFDVVNNRLTWSDEVHRIFGLLPQEFGATYEAFLDCVHPGDRAAVDAAYSDSVRENRDAYEIEHRVVRKSNGEIRIVHEKCEHMRDATGKIVRSTGMVHDITERKRWEREIERLNRTLRAHSHSDRALLRATNEAEYMQEVCRIIIEDCGHAMVWIGFAEDNEYKSVRPVAYAGFEEGYLETLRITWADTERGRGPTGTAVRTGKPGFCRDMHTDPQFTPWREEAIRRGYASSLVLPLLEDGHAFGALNIYFREPDPFTDDEIALLSSLGDGLAYGIRTIRLREAHTRVEQALRESEERYRRLFSSMTEGFALHEIVLDAEGKPCDYRFLEVNPAFERLTGLKRKNLVGRTVLEVLPSTEPFWIETYGRVALTGKPIHFEQYSSPLGRDYEVYSFRPAEHQFAALFLDVTARRQMEAALRESEEHFRTLAEMLPEIVWVTDAEGKATYVNPGYLEYAGTKLDTVEDRAQLIHPDDVARVTELYEEAAQSGSLFQCEYRMRRHDGQYRWFLARAVEVRDDDGRLAGRIGAAADIHDLKQAEEALEQRVRERTAELQASEERFGQVVENIQDVFWMFKPDTQQVLYVSPAYDEIWGRSHQDLYKDLDSFLETVHPDDREQVLQELHAGWQGFDGEFRIMRPDGEVRWIQVRSFPVRNKEGVVYRMAGVAIDRTEQKASEAALLQTERLSIAGKLAASLAHEINNPLQSVIGCLGLLQGALENDRDPEIYLEVARQEVKRTAHIVSQLRSLGRPIRDSHREPTDLNSLLNDVLVLNKKHLQTHKIEVIWKPDAGLPLLAVMPDSMHQVFLNLVINAADAMPEGGQLWLSTEYTESPDGVRVVVTDSGIGIPADVLPHIFEAFYSTKDEGMGVGLFLSQGIVQQHGGRIEVESQPGAGTTFTVWLPA
jgi:PAS domain S-box-containing protein